MGNIVNLIKCVLFLAAGLLLLLVPHKKFKEIFPKAPAAAVVKVGGVIVILCGIVMAVVYANL